MVSHRRDGLAGFDRIIDLSEHTEDPVTGAATVR
jgi:hypothetical protein